jgi:LysM repeat protein
MVRSFVPPARLRPWLIGGLSLVFAALPSTALALQSYVVQPGDTLSWIAAVNGITVAELATANGITDVNHVNAGTELVIPAAGSPVTVTDAFPGGTRVVQAGDTLSAIADDLGVDITALATANSIADPALIYVGEVLTIPGVATAPAASPSTPAPAATASYTVSAGDTLGDIAARFGTDAATLAGMNGIEDASLIVIGEVLTVPAASPVATPSTGASPVTAVPARVTHTVVAGETLSTIADQYGVTVADLMAANTLANPSLVVPGQAILVPNVISAASRAEIRAILKSAEQEFGLPDGLLQALAWQESGWQQHVVSGAGAVGVTQVLPSTALWALQFLVDGADNWQSSALDNARVGASFMKHLLDQTGGNVATAVAAYYQGWDSVQINGLYADTKQYVANVLALWPQFKS